MDYASLFESAVDGFIRNMSFVQVISLSHTCQRLHDVLTPLHILISMFYDRYPLGTLPKIKTTNKKNKGKNTDKDMDAKGEPQIDVTKLKRLIHSVDGVRGSGYSSFKIYEVPFTSPGDASQVLFLRPSHRDTYSSSSSLSSSSSSRKRKHDAPYMAHISQNNLSKGPHLVLILIGDPSSHSSCAKIITVASGREIYSIGRVTSMCCNNNSTNGGDVVALIVRDEKQDTIHHTPCSLVLLHVTFTGIDDVEVLTIKSIKIVSDQPDDITSQCISRFQLSFVDGDGGLSVIVAARYTGVLHANNAGNDDDDHEDEEDEEDEDDEENEPRHYDMVDVLVYRVFGHSSSNVYPSSSSSSSSSSSCSLAPASSSLPPPLPSLDDDAVVSRVSATVHSNIMLLPRTVPPSYLTLLGGPYTGSTAIVPLYDVSSGQQLYQFIPGGNGSSYLIPPGSGLAETMYDNATGPLFSLLLLDGVSFHPLAYILDHHKGTFDRLDFTHTTTSQSRYACKFSPYGRVLLTSAKAIDEENAPIISYQKGNYDCEGLSHIILLMNERLYGSRRAKSPDFVWFSRTLVLVFFAHEWVWVRLQEDASIVIETRVPLPLLSCSTRMFKTDVYVMQLCLMSETITHSPCIPADTLSLPSSLSLSSPMSLLSSSSSSSSLYAFTPTFTDQRSLSHPRRLRKRINAQKTNTQKHLIVFDFFGEV
eukprot:TRINITY_DN7802_c0_g1_i1.p1 TRINITY_DN7802_c0_g1~~TRINITY_DN7802_c0_g1_i1.p1  ORF type:complete len:703 (-),score=113.95 TRINITY_DN7802_c0_g1_i1:30-2138(-)